MNVRVLSVDNSNFGVLSNELFLCKLENNENCKHRQPLTNCMIAAKTTLLACEIISGGWGTLDIVSCVRSHMHAYDIRVSVCKSWTVFRQISRVVFAAMPMTFGPCSTSRTYGGHMNSLAALRNAVFLSPVFSGVVRCI